MSETPTRSGLRRVGSAIVGATREGRLTRLGGVAAIAAVLAGGQALAVAPTDAADAATASTSASTPLIAFSTGGNLWTYQAPGPYGVNSTESIAAGTSPAISYTTLGDGTFTEAFQGANGHLWIRGDFGTTFNAKDTGVAMRPGTSPAISADGGTNGGLAIAFQAAGGTLDTAVLSATGTVSATATGLPMDTNSSPAITGMASGYEIAYQTNYGHLGITGSNGVTTDTYKIMRATTTPSITRVGTGYQVAYQGSDGNLGTIGTVATKSFALPMDSKSSPSIVALTASTYEIAYQTNYGHLAVVNTAGTQYDTYQIMRAGTTPSLTAYDELISVPPTIRLLRVPVFTVVYQTSGGIIAYDVDGTDPVSTGRGMDQNSSPTSANGFMNLP